MAVKLSKDGLFALQHRGQESVGIASYDGKKIILRKGMGLVNDVFSENKLKELEGKISIGHTRYSTRGESLIRNAQPHFSSDHSFALASNGDILNTQGLIKELTEKGLKFYSQNDGELLVKMIVYYFKEETEKSSFSRIVRIIQAIKQTMKKAKGAYSALMITNQGEMFVFRDPFGFRPLVIGKIAEKTLVFASETCALDIVRAKLLREIKPGEILFLNKKINRFFYPSKKHAQCIFELIYFSRPDSVTFSENVSQIRRALGGKLAKNYPIEADIVIPVPDSSNSTALGYSEESKIPFSFGLVRSHYVGRTFIEPFQEIRDLEVKLKFNPDRFELKGKRVIIVDDSIVRATTLRKLVRMIRGAGAKQVYVMISCPPIKHPCHYGIDTPTRKELIASSKTVQEIKEFISADDLNYLSLGGLQSVVKNPQDYCYACFTGNYPVK